MVATRTTARTVEAQRWRLHFLIFSEKAPPAAAPPAAADDDRPASWPSRGVLSSGRAAAPAAGALSLPTPVREAWLSWVFAMLVLMARPIQHVDGLKGKETVDGLIGAV